MEIRKEVWTLDDIAEGFWHTDPENIAVRVIRDWDKYTDQEKNKILQRCYMGLGNNISSFELDTNGKLKFSIIGLDAAVRTYRANNKMAHASMKNVLEDLERRAKSGEELSNFERTMGSALKLEIKREETITR